MADSFDKRVTPARPDLAASHLKGKVEADRFVEGQALQVHRGRITLWDSPYPGKRQDSELLWGDIFTVYDRVSGWAWGQSAMDGYVGWVDYDDVVPVFSGGGHHVTALMTPLLTKPDLKTPVWDMLPMNAQVTVTGRESGYACIAPNLYVYEKHLSSGPDANDWVAIAERFVGVPYVWGGKTAAGLDCSGLIQTALQAVGKAAPRDTDMMEKALGERTLETSEPLQRGDLVFWKGHMGVMLDNHRLLHANAFHMLVAIEPLADAIPRINAVAGPVTSVRRI
ncbi:MAG TPA: NlpC/P60 family protein [Rhizomicrobium sp.]|jgi:hypothetical protein|nr:NlpC/P60 family protein [Rhizomicrobium sp.]